MSGPFVHVHRVRFAEVDAAGLAYFAHFFGWCHDAMAAMLADLEGGYRALVVDRKLGLPAVHVEADFSAPLRFGDEVRIATHVERVGRSSCTLRFELTRAVDGRPPDAIATLRHVVALTDLHALRATPLPADVRALLEAHQAVV
ncbi:MAG TPA: thioesterase family protein [Polyangiaceae bacterium]|nr:thioesterase family protein [Polyangiaceae bacterium]